MLKVLVVAGTADARHIIDELSKLEVNVTATVATRLGKDLLGGCKDVNVREGRLTLEGMIGLIEEIKAGCLVDASHPFAREVSENAVEACKRTCIPYLRYERPKTVVSGKGVIRVGGFEEAVNRLRDYEGNVFLAIGSSKLELFAGIPDFKGRIFARVLPDSKVLEKCERLGLDAGSIIAVKGPFSEAMNIEMLKHCNASVMVTKDSGDTGGNAEKINAAFKMGIPVIMVERPDIDYGRTANTLGEVKAFVESIAGRGTKTS